jgi:hypothetical protein
VSRADSGSPFAFGPDCPSCGMPTEVIDRFTLTGVPAAAEHIKVRCVVGHWYTIPTDSIAPTDLEPGRRPTSRAAD